MWILTVNGGLILVLLLCLILFIIGAFFIFRARRRDALLTKRDRREESQLVRWDTPFGNTSYPSVLVNYDGRSASAVVAPSGTDHYPKYLVEFGQVIALTVMDEACRPMTEIDGADHGVDLSGNSFELIGSASLRSYTACHDTEGSGNLRHFVMFGGDNIVEIVTMSEPKITQINETMNLISESSV